jgi:nickel-dependent lactate racemase
MRLPPNWQLTTIEPHRSSSLNDLRAAVEAALASPLRSRRLRDLVVSGTRVVIVFTDATRACPDHVLVPALLSELQAAGVCNEKITLLCATGLHRPSTRDEKIAKLGQAVVDRYRVIDHDPSRQVMLSEAKHLDANQAKTLRFAQGDTTRNDAEVLLIATGVVEPHQYAGYSGGGKAVVIGCGDEATISLTHGPQYLDRPGVRLGKVDGNPFQQFVRDRVRQIGLKFVVNVVLDGDGQAIAVRAGDPIAVHDELIGVARSIYEVEVPQLYDVVIAKVDPPKDVNLYQASRAPTYIGLSATPPIRSGGVIIVEARCPEGAGLGVGERRFFNALAQANDLQQLLNDFRANGCQAGEQRAFMLAQVLLKHQVIVVGSECPDVVRACKMIAADSIDDAIDQARGTIEAAASVLYLPHPLHTLPIVNSLSAF